MRWFTRYYRRTFPAGRQNATVRMRMALAMLTQNPLAGHPVEGTVVRYYPVLRTPFAILYRVTDQHIEILRLWDGRANPDRLNLLTKEPQQP